MPLIRVTRCYDVTDPEREDEIILNTALITIIYPDPERRGCWVHFAHDEPVLVKSSLEEIWTLIRRET